MESKNQVFSGKYRGKVLSNRLHYLLFEADHFSSLNHYLPWRSALGTLMLVSIAAGLCGWLMHGNAYVLLAGILGVLLLGLVWPRISIWGLSGELHFLDTRVTEGATAIVEFKFLNRCPVGLWGIRIHGNPGALREEARGDSFVHSLAFVPGWRRSQFRWEFQTNERGEYPAGELRVSTAFPFGLWEVSKPLQVAGTLLVRPRTFPVEGVPEAAANERSIDGTTMKNRVGHSGDLLGLRSYRPGDPLKRIHWIQSARHDRLIVCEQQSTASPRAQIVLDLDPEVHESNENSNTREWGIRVAASICLGLLRSGAAVGIVMADRFADEVQVHSESQMLDRLARIRPADGVPLDQVLKRAEALDFREGLQLIITTPQGLRNVPAEWGRRTAVHLLVIRPEISSDDSESDSTGNHPGISPWVELRASSDLAEEFADQWRSVLCSN